LTLHNTLRLTLIPACVICFYPVELLD